METVFPDGTGYAGFFLVGYRKNLDPPHQIQRVGTAILKRTYGIQPNFNPALGTLTPSDAPLPVFEQDIAENLVRNGNMEASQKAFGEGDSETLPGAWQAGSGATVLLAQDQGRQGTDDTGLRVTGTANSRVVQTIAFDEPLGGRSFALSVHAKADANATVNNIRLEANGTTICTLNRSLTPNYARFATTGVWPGDVEAKEMQIVLRMATDADRTVFYDDVEVLECDHKTKVDVAALYYESDLMPFKPEGDVIVLRFADQSGVNRVRVNGSDWLERSVSTNGDGLDKALFGWEPRAVDPRKSEAAFPEDDSAYPLPEALPGGFNNRFYNGYRRDSLQLSTLPYFSPGDQIRIQRPGPSNDYGFTLGNETVTAQVRYYRGYGSDDERYWHSQNIPMHADTLVIEPEKNRCYVVWRGAWDFDAHPENTYRQLVVSSE